MTTITRLSAEEVAEEVADLPAMSSSIAEVIAACDDPDITVGRISQVILRDQSLTAGILRLANSAFYGHARQVTRPSCASRRRSSPRPSPSSSATGAPTCC